MIFAHFSCKSRTICITVDECETRIRWKFIRGVISTTMTTLTRFWQNKPSSKTELRFLVKYSKVLGIFLLKLAAEVESYMMRATSSGIPPVVTGLVVTSSFGDTCICTSLNFLPFVVTTSTRTKSAFTVAFPKNGSVGTDRQKPNKGKVWTFRVLP